MQPMTSDSSDQWLVEGMSQETNSRSSPPRVARDFAEEYAARLIGLALVVVGLSLSYAKYLSWQWLIAIPWLHELIPALGEALAIAGILMVFVDEAVKKRLLREASRNIFVHMIGFDHEPELKERIKDIAFNTKLYRRDFTLTCRIEPLETGDGVSLAFNGAVEIINQSPHEVEHNPKWIFVEADSPSDCAFTAIVGDGAPKTHYSKFERVDSGHLIAEGPPTKIQPRSSGIRFRSLSSCRIEAPRNYYHAVHFGGPTIDVTIKLEAPLGWRVWIPECPNETNEMMWHSASLRMTGEHIEIHWRGPDPQSRERLS